MRALIVPALIAVAALTACGTTHPGNRPAPPADNNAGEQQATEAAAPETGTRDNPYAPGDTFDLGDWEVSLAESNTDATDEILAENQFNDIADGRVAVMVEATITYTGSGSASPLTKIRSAFVGGDGLTYDYSDLDANCGLVPDDAAMLGDMYTDATAKGNYCAAIPPEAVDGGTWLISTGFGHRGVEAFVALS